MEATDAEVLSFLFFVLGIVIIVIREILEPPEYDSRRRAKSSYHWEYMRHKEMLGVGRKHKE